MEITTKEAAVRLGVGLRQVQILIKKGRLPARKWGRDYVIDEKDLEIVKERPKTGRPKKNDK
jgi:excisionase family DNA binding protein